MIAASHVILELGELGFGDLATCGQSAKLLEVFAATRLIRHRCPPYGTHQTDPQGHAQPAGISSARPIRDSNSAGRWAAILSCVRQSREATVPENTRAPAF